MRFYTTVQAPPRVVASSSARMIRKMGRIPRICILPGETPGGIHHGFHSPAELDEFLREHVYHTDFHVRAALRLTKRHAPNADAQRPAVAGTPPPLAGTSGGQT